MSTGSVRVALLQTRTPDTPDAAWAHLAPLLEQAIEGEPDLIVTPETCNLMQRDRRLLPHFVVPEAEDPTVLGVRAFAAARKTWVLLGSVVVREGTRLFANRSLLIDAGGGVAARYDKIHLFDADLSGGAVYRESNAYRPGEEAVVAATPFGGLGLSICYDVRFPELYRDLALAGASFIATPAAFTRPTGEAHWETLLRARAIETGAFVLAAAQGGTHADGSATWGRSMAIGPWGEVLARLDHDEPGVCLAELSPTAVAQARAAVPALRNRRPYKLPRPSQDSETRRRG